MERTVLRTPIGGIGLVVDDEAVVGVSFADRAFVDRAFADRAFADEGGGSSAVLAEAVRQLGGFFAGELTDFELPLAVRRGSEFERAVWAAIATIPYGETLSYGAIARAVGEPGGAQAVGLACNRNPLPIVVPCHRVIGSDGKLVGFGGGLDRKRWLLQLEARIHIERTFTMGW